MKLQFNIKPGENLPISIPLTLGAVVFVIMLSASFWHKTPQEPTVVAVAIEVEVPAKVEVPASECDIARMMITPTVVGDPPEMLYKYKGKRTLVTIPNKIDADQAALLAYAFNVAKADGHKEPAILQGLIWQESKAGGYPDFEVAGGEFGLAVGKRYYGVGQIKVAAARDVIKKFPDEFPDVVGKTDEYIIAKLIFDDRFNIRVASKYLWMMGHNETKSPVFVRPTNYAITAYNRGLGNTYDTDYNNWHYTVSVHQHKDTFIKTFNSANNIK